MKIAIYEGHATGGPEAQSLRNLMIDARVEYEIVSNRPGGIAYIPCIVAFFDNDTVAECFGVGATVEQIIAAANADGTSPVNNVPLDLTATQFHALAGDVITDARLGDILNDLETASKSGGAARVAWQRYSAANASGGIFTKAEVERISAGLVALGIMDDATERQPILNAWPVKD